MARITEVESFEVEEIITLLIRLSSSCRLSQIETLPEKQRRLAGDASVDWLRDPDHVGKKNSNPCDWVVFHFPGRPLKGGGGGRREKES